MTDSLYGFDFGEPVEAAIMTKREYEMVCDLIEEELRGPKEEQFISDLYDTGGQIPLSVAQREWLNRIYNRVFTY